MIIRALLAATLTGGGLVLLGGGEPGDRLTAGVVALVIAGTVVGVDVLSGIRRRRRPPDDLG